MNRFFVPTENIGDDYIVFTAEQAHQITNVLRLRPGQTVIALDNEGGEYEVVLTELRNGCVRGRICQQRIAAGEPAVELTLFQSLLRRQNFEWVLQKCTELGVTRFVPVVTERTVVRPQTDSSQKLVRWQRILAEAAEQCGRGRIPELAQPLRLDQALEQFRRFDRVLIPWEKSDRSSLATALRSDTPLRTIAIVIGPEGGFSEQEIQSARQHGALAVTLGPRILRSETAAVVTCTAVLYELGQLQR